ncbi:LysR family transcriptional regulator [Kiloniella litopenaei]|uniref:LysR family transcriptional regulator n=1 Tax=Kiloniella litopenaei TaxID=1549748 RepID=UPI003BAA2B9C
MVSFIQIQTFIEVAKTESFTKASKLLMVPRSTVSARIQALEESLNVALLTRTTRKVSLTHEGQRYYDRCFEAMDTLKSIEEEFQDKEVLKGLIRLTVPIDLPKEYLASLLCEFNALHPDVVFDVIVTDNTLDMVSENIDLAFRGKNPGSDSLVARKISAGEMVFVTSPDIAAKSKARSLSDVLKVNPLLDPTGLAKELNFVSVEAFISTKNFELSKCLAIKGEGIALLPKTVCEMSLNSGELVPFEFEWELPELSLYLVRPAKKHLPRRVRAFVDFLVNYDKDNKL